MKTKLNQVLLSAIILILCGMGVNVQVLYVGANYHPHGNKNIEKIKTDIQLIKDTGLTVVRMGHLGCDS